MSEGELSDSPERVVERWDYKNHLEPYLIRISEEGSNGLEPISRFPKQIELSSEWHEVQDQMRRETEDSYERWTPIGFRRETRDIFVPKTLLRGTKRSVPPESFHEGIVDDTAKLGITHLIGDIHSHPGWGKNYLDRFFRTGRIITEYKGFSPTDMFRTVNSKAVKFLVFGLVDSGANYYSFLTKETEPIPLDSKLAKSIEFQYYWFYEHTLARFHKNIPIPYPKSFSLWDVNLAIAKEYNISLYRGKPGEDLIRHYP